jgi:hypothetical protein
VATELLDCTQAYLRDGQLYDELYNGVQDVGDAGRRLPNGEMWFPRLIREPVSSVEEAANLTNTRYSMGRAGAWYKEMTQRAASLEEEAAQLAQRGSRLRSAGRVLGVVGVGLQTGMAIYDDYKNCADAVTTINDAVFTAGSSGAVLAAPPLALVDLATGGAVSGFIHNAAITPITIGRVALGNVNGRDAAAIRSTYTRFAAGRWVWGAGEWLADTLMGD